MVFNSDVFLFAFLPAVFALFWLVPTNPGRHLVLTAASYVFYGWWNWRFCALLLFSSLVSFTAALMIERSPGQRTKRAWLIAAVGVDLSILGFFKYYNFFAANLGAVAPGLTPPLLDLVLPIGISFYTFHTISYIADVAVGRVRATRSVLEYLTYVSLFTQLVAGPIVRYRQIANDLGHLDGPLRADHVATGLAFFVIGLIKKVVIADRIAQYIDPIIATPADMSFASAWLAALGYAFQLYYDFSGYSDMAVGIGYLFRVHIPQNFDAPYRATGIRDFWRRWHMSLSSWLRDYLYIPLGGNRGGPVRTRINLMATMLLGGLWHGANWTFVAWGGYHGVLLVLERELEGWWDRVPVGVRRAATFGLVTIGWVLFRAQSLTAAGTWLGAMAGFGVGDPPPVSLLLWVIAALVAVQLVPETWEMRFRFSPRWAVLYALGFSVAYLFMNERKTVFLYYQF